MSRKAESIMTSKMMNKAAHEDRKAARAARRQARAFDRIAAVVNKDVEKCYVSMNGMSVPIFNKI